MSAKVKTGFERWAVEQKSARKRGLTYMPFALPYKPFPKQREFHESPAKYRLFGGAAGPGKTKALLMEGLLQANEHAGADTLLLRRTFPELESTLLLYFRRDVPRELYRSYNDSKHIVTWLNGATTRFGYSQSENDIYQYQGAEFLFIGIDELTLFTLRQWQFLTSRNRSPVANAFPCMAGATNPGNIGHAWVKALWVDRRPAAGMEHAEEYDASDYDFISARVFDNPIYARDENYLKTLRALPRHLRMAFLEGNWEVFAGQYFDNFDPARQVTRAEAVRMEPWWRRWISIDWGFEHPAAVHWHAQGPGAATGATGEGAGRRAGQVITYRELVENHLAPRQLAGEIIARSRNGTDSAERISAIYLSPDAFAHRTDEASIAEQMGEVLVGAGLPRPAPADDDRIGGWMLMYQMLSGDEWRITENCSELIRLLPTLTRDAARVEDIQKRDGDDAADAARYGLQSAAHLRAARAPLEDRIAERVSKMREEAGAGRAEPTAVAMMSRIAEEKERRKNIPIHRARRHCPKFRGR